MYPLAEMDDASSGHLFDILFMQAVHACVIQGHHVFALSGILRYWQE